MACSQGVRHRQINDLDFCVCLIRIGFFWHTMIQPLPYGSHGGFEHGYIPRCDPSMSLTAIINTVFCLHYCFRSRDFHWRTCEFSNSIYRPYQKNSSCIVVNGHATLINLSENRNPSSPNFSFPSNNAIFCLPTSEAPKLHLNSKVIFT